MVQNTSVFFQSLNLQLSYNFPEEVISCLHCKFCLEEISDGYATVQEIALIYLMPLKLLPLQPASKTEINTVATTMKKKKCSSNSYRGLKIPLKVPKLCPMPRTALQALCVGHGLLPRAQHSPLALCYSHYTNSERELVLHKLSAFMLSSQRKSLLCA